MAERLPYAGSTKRLRHLAVKGPSNSRRGACADKTKSRLHLWLCRSEKRRNGLLRFHLLRPSAKWFSRRAARFQSAIRLGAQGWKFQRGPEPQRRFIRARRPQARRPAILARHLQHRSRSANHTHHDLSRTRKTNE